MGDILMKLDHCTARLVLCTVTLGAPGDAQRLDSLVGPPTKRFMLHYCFPPFSINEVGKRSGLNRREVGHGTLAEKALLAVLPPEDDFPYTVRVNSEVMASDGSTSMATVCAGSMALMDAGIPLREHVAGVSVGLVSEVDPSTGMIKEYQILTDILGLEDHLGDMDFKIAGTRKGVTAIQLDIKPAGIPLDIICECLEPALKGRLQILDHMEREINAPRTQDNRNSPRVATLKFSNESIRRFIGPQGVQKKKIEQETGARISISDGTLTIVAKNQAVMEKTQEKVDFIIGREIEVGGIYKGIVASVKEYGAFVEFNGGQQGLLHISELSHEPVSRVSDVLSIGQELSLMCIEQDVRGNIKLSLKAASSQPGSDRRNADVKDSVTPTKPTHYVWTSVENVSNCQETPSSTFGEESIDKYEDQADTAMHSSPSILIRSAAECDAQESLSDQCFSKKTDKTVKSSTISSSSLSSRKKLTNPVPLKRNSNKKEVEDNSEGENGRSATSHSSVVKNANYTRKGSHAGGVSAKSLRLGDRLTAKVYQIRAHGLVLELRGGMRGMYRFEGNGKRAFKIGEELRVECSSFSSRGVPVMSLLDDML